MNFIDKAKEAFATTLEAAPAKALSAAAQKKFEKEMPVKARIENARKALIQNLIKRRGGGRDTGVVIGEQPA